jgi:hypothetical protein
MCQQNAATTPSSLLLLIRHTVKYPHTSNLGSRYVCRRRASQYSATVTEDTNMMQLINQRDRNPVENDQCRVGVVIARGD